MRFFKYWCMIVAILYVSLVATAGHFFSVIEVEEVVNDCVIQRVSIRRLGTSTLSKYTVRSVVLGSQYIVDANVRISGDVCILMIDNKVARVRKGDIVCAELSLIVNKARVPVYRLVELKNSRCDGH